MFFSSSNRFRAAKVFNPSTRSGRTERGKFISFFPPHQLVRRSFMRRPEAALAEEAISCSLSENVSFDTICSFYSQITQDERIIESCFAQDTIYTFTIIDRLTLIGKGEAYIDTER